MTFCFTNTVVNGTGVVFVAAAHFVFLIGSLHVFSVHFHSIVTTTAATFRFFHGRDRHVCTVKLLHFHLTLLNCSRREDVSL